MCGEDHPAAAQMSCMPTHNEKDLEAAIFKVECVVTSIGDGRPEDS